jgi:hypothetical protein
LILNAVKEVEEEEVVVVGDAIQVERRNDGSF